ncbi:benzoate/H(+) symporter BenE family transporter [Streptomyces formicae]|uniref:benzoate/H(+) symporter BenE family transporter n=1 Tax=Streptomyces formicae TaxID=1616117 RepID=UPI002412C36F|nr:benzoate/H(+) symporter BenE family transporter [Streptomyces formicae]
MVRHTGTAYNPCSPQRPFARARSQGAVSTIWIKDLPRPPVDHDSISAPAATGPERSLGINLAAMTAAICTGDGAHPDRQRRYLAAVWAGVFCLCVGLLGATVASLLTAMPHALVLAVAGVGLLATIEASLASALSDPASREAAVVTFLATASGVTLLGIGSAF